MARISLPQFDRAKDFVVNRPVLLSGRRFKQGDLLDKSLLNIRLLRQLFEQRYVTQIDAPTEQLVINGYHPNEITPLKKEPDLKVMTEQELRTWLVGNGVIPRPRATKAQMLQRARKILKERKKV